jgi:hypothetical protein
MEDPQLYIRKSPLFKMDKVQAPVLIFHGSADRNVPPAQSWSFFRALQYYGKVPVKFVVFPGEPHGPQKLTHQIRKVEDEVAWFDKYFFKTTKPENEAFKKDSLLAEAIRKQTLKRNSFSGSFGVSRPDASSFRPGEDVHVSTVIPEVTRRSVLEIGRLEVTDAQYYSILAASGVIATRSAKDNDVKNPHSKGQSLGNFPISGVSLKDAQEYADRLSKWTGEIWRLPYEDEVKDLYENRDGENTLDYWAGYAPNPEDAARLREKAKELGETAPLLKEAGSFRGQGKDDEEPIYDLGGNVAEWVLTRDGKGKVMGGSADCPADPKSNCTPAQEYIGFRVVRGAAKPVAAKQ